MKIAELFVRLTADTSGLKGGLSNAERLLDKFGKTANRVAGLVGAGLFAGMVKNSIEAQNAIAQLNAVVKSTGGVAGFTTPQLQKMATELQNVSTFSDEAIMGAQGLLLTFTRIKGAELQGATKAVMNLAQAMGGDLKGAAIQVGKALNDPKLGLTALRKAGIQFSESQTAAIKKLVETGKVAEAQRIILAELEVQFGGSAEAARNTLGGALKALSNAFGDALEVSGEATSGIVQGINSITDAMPGARKAVNWFFTNFNLAAIEAAAWVTRLNDKLAMLQLRFASALSKIGLKAWAQNEASAAMKALEGSMNGGVDAVERWRQAQIAAVLGLDQKNRAVRAVTTSVDELAISTSAATAAAKALASAMREIGDVGRGRMRVDIAAMVERNRGWVNPVQQGAADAVNSRALQKRLSDDVKTQIGAGRPSLWQRAKGALAGRPQNNDSMGTRVGQVLQAGGGGSEMGQMAQAFASFGPMAALLPVINGAMERLGPAFSKLIAPLVDLGATIGEILAPIFEMLAPVLQLVVSSFKLFHPILRGVVIAFSYLMEGLGWVVKGLGKLIDSLPFVSAKGIIRMGEEMIDAARAARKNTDATDDATDAVEKFAGALSNIPRVLNVNALRHMVTGGGGPLKQPPSRPLFTGPINININGAGDPRRVAEEVGRAIERTGSRGGLSRLQLALA